MSRESKRYLLLGLLTLWGAAWGISFLAFASGTPGGEGNGTGMNRTTAFLGWQLVAVLPAFASWIVGRSWPADSGVRFVSRVPIQLAAGLAVALGGVLLVVRIAT